MKNRLSHAMSALETYLASINHTRRRVCLYLQCAQHRCDPGRAMAAWDRAQAVDHVFVEERSGDFGE